VFPFFFFFFFFAGRHFGSLKKQRGPNRNDLIRQRRCVVSLCSGGKMFIAFQHDVLARAHRHSHPHTVRFDLTRSHAAKGDMLTCAPGV
jgi:hypothetical protein